MLTVAVLDACVLYPASLRDLLLHLAVAGLFQARWPDEIHEEWIRGVLRERPELADELRRTRRLMDTAVEGCLVSGYQALLPSLSLPDLGDRHVLAAALTGGADVIVTSNLKDFPPDVLDRFGLQAMHPDAFLCMVMELDPAASIAAVRAHRSRLKRPSKTAGEYIETLARLGLPRTVAFLRCQAALI